MFQGCSGVVPGCSGLFRAVPGCSRGCSGDVPGVFRGVPGVFRGVPGFTDTPPVLCETYFVIYKLFISYVTPISMLFYHYKGVYFRAIQLYVKTMQTLFQTYADATF